MNAVKRATLASWNGRQMPLEEVLVPALDRAFLFGDAVYEVIRVYNGRLFRIEDHFDRLAKSMMSLSITGVDLSALKTRLAELLAASEIAEALAYVQVTRGAAKRTHAYPADCTPNVLMFVEEFADPYALYRAKGAAAVTHPDIRWQRNDIKATSLAANCMAAQYAKEHDALEVIFIDSDGRMTEGSHTSIFGVKKGEIIVSPSSPKVLPGITKKQILELSKAAGITISERRVSAAEIHDLDEMCLAGTPEEIVPIVSVDGKPIGNGQPGPVIKLLQEEFRKALAACAGAQG